MSSLSLALAFAALPAGCRSGEQDRVKHAVHAWHADLAHGRGSQACARLTAGGRKDFLAGSLLGAFGDCELLVKDTASMLTAIQRRFLALVVIRRVEIHGDRALVHDRDVMIPPQLRELAMPVDEPTVLRKVDGRWLLDDLG